MFSWYAFFIILISIAAVAQRRFRRRKNLPPGPPSFPIIGNPAVVGQSFANLELYLLRLMGRHGPLVSMKIGTRFFVFIGSHSLAHRALITDGITYADRPDVIPMLQAISKGNIRYINTSSYGPTWRALRRNITGKMMVQTVQNRAHSDSRIFNISRLINRLSHLTGSSVQLNSHIDHVILSMLVFMCFGVSLPDCQIKEIGDIVQGMGRNALTSSSIYIFPYLGRILFRKGLKEMVEVHQHSMRVFIPLIRARIHAKRDAQILTYVDTLVDLHLPEENRKLEEEEMATLCGEFFLVGNDTTTTIIEWIMANLVKHRECQDKLYDEVESVVGKAPPIRAGEEILEKVVKEGDLEQMPYLKAVVLEALRRHPPGHFSLPRKLNEDVELDGYTIPKDTTINFMLAGMGMDPHVWEDPLEFKPERFLGENGEAFDITGSKEIKMIPFGAGRRICPGIWMGMLHVRYVVANLIWYFEWSSVEGGDVDLTEKVDFTTVMKNPLQTRISTRFT